jgi:hypothetical protein
MPLFRIGEKDRHGRQKRIEYPGRYLRVSRTGLVSLRAQTRVAGVNATANTRHGVRLSTRVAKNTQVAIQHGRFVLRGRYGSDGARFNLSRSGMTVSTRMPGGTLNWIRPGRSSFKLAGVQVRGQKAVWLQLAYLLVLAVLGVLQLLWQVLAALLSGLYGIALGTVTAVQLWRSGAAQEKWLAALDPAEARALAREWLGDRLESLAEATHTSRLGALGYGLTCLGRGEARGEPTCTAPAAGAGPALGELMRAIQPAGGTFRDGVPAPDDPAFPLVALGLVLHAADALDDQLSGDAREQALLLLDDACLAGGPKTVLQEAMLDALAARWQARLVLAGEG